MSTSRAKTQLPLAENVITTGDALRVDISDGRTISVPLAWFPRLLHASPGERRNWRLIGKGRGIRWKDVDECVSVEGLLAGIPSGESQASLANWLAGRESRLASRRARRSIPRRRSASSKKQRAERIAVGRGGLGAPQ
ncbi:MAG: DUF2442 domain-containing protein [Phycisphaerae bacterium]|nr:DUF2442 domain-containing protein [Phycisphaerae bacterium]